MSGDDRGPLILPGDQEPFGATIPEVEAGRSITFGSIPVCTDDGSRPAEIDAIEPVSPNGIEVVAFGTRAVAGDSYFGSEAVDLEGAGFDSSDHEISAECERPEELALELRRPIDRTGISEGFAVSFVTDGGVENVLLDFHVVLCAPGDESTPDC